MIQHKPLHPQTRCLHFFSPTVPPQALLNLCHSAIKRAPGLPQSHRSHISTFHFHLNVIPIHYLTFELHPLKVPCISLLECSIPRLTASEHTSAFSYMNKI